MKEWWTPKELAEAGLPDIPGTDRAIQLMADRQNWRDPGREHPANPDGTWRRRAGRGGGYEYRIDVLPIRAKTQLALRLRRAEAAHAAPKAKETRQIEDMWAWFERLPAARQKKGYERQKVLLAIRDAQAAGLKREDAVIFVALQEKVHARTLYAWQEMVHGLPVAHWPAYLTPRHAGRLVTAEYDDAAWEFYRDLYLRQSEPSSALCYRQLQAVAKEKGWALPSRKTLERRMAKLSTAQRVLSRKGPEALKKLYPAQQRDRSSLHALEAVNSDGHQFDVFVRWPDGEVGRPILIGFQDLYSGKILSWRVDRTEHWDLVRLAFADMVEAFGAPDRVLLDNGRAFASKQITGGQKSRYRFKVKEDDPEGVITALGSEVVWTTPYNGQAKPIERAWKDFAANISRDVRFEGAWAGNTIANKPENYGSKAVPLETFLAVVTAGVIEHNARAGRQSKVCGGRLSFDHAFEASYSQSLVRRPTEAQLRKLMLTAEAVTARRPDGAVYLADNRYWAEFLADHMGRKLMLRFDPQDLHSAVHVYRLDGAYLGAAPCVEAAGFFNTEAARAHAKARRAFIRATKEAAAAARKLSLDDLAAMLPQTEAPPPPEAKVVRPFFSANGNAALKVDREEEQEDFEAAFGRSVNTLGNVTRIFRNDGGAED